MIGEWKSEGMLKHDIILNTGNINYLYTMSVYMHFPFGSRFLLDNLYCGVDGGVR